MAERRVTVNMKPGLQARQAALFVQEANRFGADIFLKRDDRQVNAKSIMGVMSLAIAKGSQITLIAEGNDEEQALAALAELVEKEN
ncbi:HPr family phosphocarrier protein [Sporosarcina pasteurii]|uniref:Catabolite repression HPr n=1 Tax=Sporosarcina pasteurii TaxID=1474 RepID=A0A380CB36_SPOPA|nr:HPr family phosphocarrier protein [Sporosarcina pasteurii]MDS9472690.1 HPr family phosphocarrier protein [Sporosarcina pasteurii]QBQ04349.1 HPr family phosphocarrier protein [Sporosarcina pasteurii]SUJ15780.1 Catabolite repression HPr [Sporosarcina pasteurii]